MIVIFDLDGTLVDTYPVIRKTLIEVFQTHLPNLVYDEEFLKSFFGPPLLEAFSKIANSKEQTQFFVDEYRRINAKYYEDEIQLFPNTLAILEKLNEKHELAIVSNRIKNLIDIALKATKIEQYFKLVLGVDNIEKPKPNPDGILQVLRYYDTKKAVYIGDALTDVMTAKNAGIPAIGVTWALTTKEQFEEIKTDYIANDFTELYRILEEIDV